MQKSLSKSSSRFDVAIVGAGLMGLSLAVALERLGKRVVLLDEGDQLGGSNSPAHFESFQFDKGLRFLPNTETSPSSVQYLESLLDQAVPTETRSSSRIAYEAGEFKDFLGFGDSAPESIDELSYFLASEELVPSIKPFQWIKILSERFSGTTIHPAYVTRFHATEGQVTHLTYNTNKDVHADYFVYCGGIRDMMHLFDRELIASKIHQKVAKAPIWTSLCLDVLHTDRPEKDSDAIHVLNHGTKDEPEYFIGRFAKVCSHENPENKINISHWVTLLGPDITEDSEQVATILKKMKRQLKKVYPDHFENPIQERVSLMPASLGTVDLGLKDPMKLPKLSNFYLGSAQLSSKQNLLGALERSQVLANLFETQIYKDDKAQSPVDPANEDLQDESTDQPDHDTPQVPADLI